MKPYLSLPFIGEFHTNSLAIILSLLCAFLFFFLMLKNSLKLKNIRPLTLFTLILVTSVMAFFGARLFHVIVERPSYFLQNPELIFTQFDGMTFYGALAGGGFCLWIFLTFSRYSSKLKNQIWDASIFSTCLTLVFMRLGCFANGCCWGKISGSPWAVQFYDPRSVMPYKGIPVHPVQLYDSALAFTIGVILWVMWKERFIKESLVPYFLILYSLSRFFTEYFRADSFRGENILLGLSVSQLISVFLLFSSLFYLWRRRIFKNLQII